MEVVVTQNFRADVVDMVRSEKVFDQIMALVLDTLPIIPTIGNNDLPPSIVEKFGNDVRRAFVKPFLVVYEYDIEAEKVIVYGLMHERQAY